MAVITLNNPAKMNALTEPMGDALGARVAEVAADTKVGAACRLKYMSYDQKNIYFVISYNKYSTKFEHTMLMSIQFLFRSPFYDPVGYFHQIIYKGIKLGAAVKHFVKLCGFTCKVSW